MRQIDPQLEVAVLLHRPEVLVALGLGLGIVVDDAVEDLPVTVVSLGNGPVAEVLAVEERLIPLGHRIRRGRCGEGEGEDSEEEKGGFFHHGGNLRGIAGKFRTFSQACIRTRGGGGGTP